MAVPKSIALTRLAVAWATIVMTAMAVVVFWQTLPLGPEPSHGALAFSIVRWFCVGLFALLFGWIAFSFNVATLGFWRGWRRHEPVRACLSETSVDPSTASGTSRCAVLVPIYNESPEDVFARVEAMVMSLSTITSTESDETPGPPVSRRFDFYVLSDSTDAEIWLAEESAWADLVNRFACRFRGTEIHPCRVYYRHRHENKGRKAGNIADFCERWSLSYPFMIVLDADSLMEARTMIEMVHRMDGDPELGILQVPPTPIGRESFFARLQQFSAAAYGRVFCEGFDAWAGDQGNYWGHNAIIRVNAFLDCCDLPVLPGKAPLGGEILSHDFVEASLMVRRGWKVRLANDLSGSYEECPTTLTDYAIRDQRWSQGNLQHSRLVVREGFHAISRFHFISGVLAYVTSPLWILFTLVSLSIWMTVPSDGVAMQGFGSGLGGSLGLFLAAMIMLFVPKMYGVALIAARGESAGFGGVMRLIGSVILEMVMSVLLSPIMALLHTRFVVSTLLGRKVRWSAQQRGEHGVTLLDAMRDYGGAMMIGILASVFVWSLAAPVAIWFTPIAAGLVLAVPIAIALGSRPLGMGLRRRGWLLIPSEVVASPVHRRYQSAIEDARSTVLLKQPVRSHFESVLTRPHAYAIHQDVLAASESDCPLAHDERELVRMAFEKSVVEVPTHLRRRVLNDAELLRELHVRANSTLPHPGGLVIEP